MQGSAVHAGNAKEKTVTRTVRMPVSLLKQIEAVQAKHGDPYLNDAAVRCLSIGVHTELRDKAA